MKAPAVEHKVEGALRRALEEVEHLEAARARAVVHLRAGAIRVYDTTN
jgi:hypothetical protein